MIKKTKKYINGFSLVEILIVISIFGIIGVLATRSVFMTLRGAKKSESLVRVRENVNYSLAVIERQLRNAESITCPNPSTDLLNYVSLEGTNTSFSCAIAATTGHIASGSARLTADDIQVTDCSFTCTQSDLNNPPSVKISVSAVDTVTTGIEKGSVSSQTEIVLRNY